MSQDGIRYALFNELGVVCITFTEPTKLQKFATAAEAALAAASASAEKEDSSPSAVLFDSEMLSMIASQFTEVGEAGGVEPDLPDDWDLVDTDFDL